jgi:hypothetical protein
MRWSLERRKVREFSASLSANEISRKIAIFSFLFPDEEPKEKQEKAFREGLFAFGFAGDNGSHPTGFKT